jgi:hypothetical protein
MPAALLSRLFRTVIAALLVCLSACACPAAEPGIEFFEKKVRPVLVEHCYRCHSAHKKVRGGLALDSRDGLRQGGESGPALVPGKPQDSRIIRAVRQTDDLKMPPKGKLSDTAIADLETWVRMGAPDPRSSPESAAITSWAEALRERRKWWSLQPVRRHDIPDVADRKWSDHPVDRFLLAHLERAGLVPAAPADRRTFLRRASLVLSGLPPSETDVEEFVADTSPLAVEKVVDRLLASPHFGERWARHWMDVVRFTETHGNEWNYDVHHAWRYRDYLIRAFNQDVPFDQLIREHIAGDLMTGPVAGAPGLWDGPVAPGLRGDTSPKRQRGDGSVAGAPGLWRARWNVREQCNESVQGTAFWRFGEVGHDDCIEFRKIGFDIADNQIDTLTKAFQATTVACARCHDHKIDAVSMKDYYAVLGILRGSRSVAHCVDAPDINASTIEELTRRKAAIRRELAALWLHDLARRKTAIRQSLDGLVNALKTAKPVLGEPLYPWVAMQAQKPGDAAGFAAAWKQLADANEQAIRDRSRIEASSSALGDFRGGSWGGWHVEGHGLRAAPGKAGDFAIAGDGDSPIAGVFPAGAFTHSLSQKLNGAIRSPVVPGGHKFVSIRALGGRTAAVRLVSNNCQLNYKNNRVLKSDDLGWVTFPVPEEVEMLRGYVEVMTKLDNPKFPDQLGQLSGDDVNMRVPYEQAAADTRSYFGVTRVVLHDKPEPPAEAPTYLRPLFAGTPLAGIDDLAARYAVVAEAAVKAWAEDRATDDDVRWLAWFLRQGLLTNRRTATPALASLISEYREVEKRLKTPRLVPGVEDVGPYDQPILTRGDSQKPGEVAAHGYVAVLTQPSLSFREVGSGRLQLAEAIADPHNPLTARVFVNRVWHHLFGSGLVRTCDDFGRVGDLPSHPELLDYLADRFVADGWSIKRLVRSLVLTRAFAMSSRSGSKGKEIDPQNRLLHHYPARRMEAEAIRDSILATSGRLDPTLYGPSIAPYRKQENADRRLFPGPLDGLGRRSLYIKVNLMESPHFLGAFNFPGGKSAQGRRDVTNVPAQALALLNDPFVLQQASVWADRLVATPAATVSARIEQMFRTALSRPPRAEEREAFTQAVAELATLHGIAPERVLASTEVWKDVAHTLFNLTEFVYIP